jgi:hypothetical protein
VVARRYGGGDSDEEVESARLVRLFAQHIQEKRAPALRVIHGGAAAG